MSDAVRIEIKRSHRKNLYAVRIGDISGALTASNISIEEILKLIREEVEKLPSEGGGEVGG